MEAQRADANEEKEYFKEAWKLIPDKGYTDINNAQFWGKDVRMRNGSRKCTTGTSPSLHIDPLLITPIRDG